MKMPDLNTLLSIGDFLGPASHGMTLSSFLGKTIPILVKHENSFNCLVPSSLPLQVFVYGS